MIWNEVCENPGVKKIEQGFFYAAFTDRIVFLKWPFDQRALKIEQEITGGELSESKLVECRIFNENFEYRLARTDLGRNWKERFIDDRDEIYKDYFDETQYLDVDDTNSEKKEGYCVVTATGGGNYELPIEDFKNAMIRIRNYVGYYKKSGQAYIMDWRMVRFEKGEKEDGTILS